MAGPAPTTEHPAASPPIAAPLNRKERRRLAAGTKKAPVPCPCCQGKHVEAGKAVPEPEDR